MRPAMDVNGLASVDVPKVDMSSPIGKYSRNFRWPLRRVSLGGCTAREPGSHGKNPPPPPLSGGGGDGGEGGGTCGLYCVCTNAGTCMSAGVCAVIVSEIGEYPRIGSVI